MRKFFEHVKKFILSHYKFSFFVMLLMFVLLGIVSVHSSMNVLSITSFVFSFISAFRLFAYKTGKIPIFMIDKTWNKYKLKYSEEEVEKQYKIMCINRATVYFIIAIASFITSLGYEVIIHCFCYS